MPTKTTYLYDLTTEQAADIEAAILANPGANVLDTADAINLPVQKIHQFLFMHPRGRELARQRLVAASDRGRHPFWWTADMPVKPRAFNNPLFKLPVPVGGSKVVANMVASFNDTTATLARRVTFAGRRELRKIVVAQWENVAMIGKRDKIIETSKRRIYQLEGEKVTLANTLRDFQEVIALNTELLKRGNVLLLAS